MMRSAFAILVALLSAQCAAAQDVVVPADRTNQIDTGCQVQDLDPNGDGFLALRAGPGTGYPKIGELRALSIRLTGGQYLSARSDGTG